MNSKEHRREMFHEPEGVPLSKQTRRDFLKNSSLAGGALALGAASPLGGAAGLSSATAAPGAAAGVGGASTSLFQLARVWVDADTAHLLGAFDDTHNVFDDGSVELLLWPGDLARLEETGLRYRITESDLATRDAELAEGAVRPADLDPQPGEQESQSYRTLAEYNADMQMLAEQNPDICELITLPAKSLQGRTIYGLEIAENVAKKDGRPVFYNDGIHHAREWPAAEVPIMWAFDLIESYRRATDPTATKQLHDLRMANIVRHSRNVIIPVVNVDGFDYSRTGPAGTGRQFDSSLTGVNPVAGMQYWRKNMRGVKVAGVGPYNPGNESGTPQNGILPTTPGAVGVDPNRNYSYRWGGNGSSASQTSATYRGDEPFSEPEPDNVQWAHRTYQCVAGITHHTSGDLVLWAWGDTHDDAPDDALLARLGFACGDFNTYRPTKSIDLYVTTGTCSDYTYGTFGSISYTFEHAGSSFHPPYPATVPSMYARNREALMLMIELVCLEPSQRQYMKEAIAAFGDPRRGPYTLEEHLTGSFRENISATDYDYPASNALDLDARYNCVITGRLVDADGVGVAGSITNTKVFENLLTPGNPISEFSWPEEWRSTIETEADGTFRWIVYPTTRPAEEFAGRRETVTITAETPDGRTAQVDGVYLSRGDTADLGDIVVS